MEESLNDEEIAADAAITDTFQKIMVRSSPKIFKLAFNKLKRYVEVSLRHCRFYGCLDEVLTYATLFIGALFTRYFHTHNNQEESCNNLH